MNLSNKLKTFHFPEWSIPLGLLGICALAYTPLLPELGLYWDDWTQLLVNHLFDLSKYWEYFSSDRPFSAWTHILFVPLLGYKPLHWHLLSFLLRYLTVVGMWWTFSQLWPRRKSVVTLAAFLFAVYPSFTQQSDAVAYHQHWTQYFLYFVSLGSMVVAVRASGSKRRKQFWLFTTIAIVTLVLHLTITEFFIGVELLRSMMICFLLDQIKNYVDIKKDAWQRLKDILVFWWPYLLIDIIFVFWRIFLYSGEKNDAVLITEMISEPLSTGIKVIRFALLDSLNILVTSWSSIFELRLLQSNQPMVIFSWVVSITSAVALAFYLARLSIMATSEPHQATSIPWRWQFLILGGLVVLLGPSPIWAAGRQLVTPLTVDFHIDRFSMVAMYGASLIFAVGIDWLIRDWKRKTLILAAVIGLATGFHLRTGNDYRWIWTQEQRFYWQLLWRVPYLQPNTAIIIEDEILPHQEHFSTSSALNFLYPQEQYPKQVAYWLYSLYPRYANNFPDGYLPSFHTKHRIYHFAASAPNTILIQYDPNQTASCLWVLRPEDENLPDLSPLMKSAIHISNPDRISNQSQGVEIVEEILGPEPKYDWCYYFEKADLARQYGDWAQVTALGDEAKSQGYVAGEAPANSPYEWLPFIQGYLNEGKWKEAAELTVINYETKKDYGNLLCKLWSEHYSDSTKEAISKIETQVGCNFQ